MNPPPSVVVTYFLACLLTVFLHSAVKFLVANHLYHAKSPLYTYVLYTVYKQPGGVKPLPRKSHFCELAAELSWKLDCCAFLALHPELFPHWPRHIHPLPILTHASRRLTPRSTAPPPPPANTRRWTNVVLMLGRRRRRRANIKTTLVQCLVFAGRPPYKLCRAKANSSNCSL